MHARSTVSTSVPFLSSVSSWVVEHRIGLPLYEQVGDPFKLNCSYGKNNFSLDLVITSVLGTSCNYRSVGAPSSDESSLINFTLSNPFASKTF